MESFTLQIPTKIIFGEDTIPQIGEEVKKYGKKVLLVYGKGSIKRIGVYDTVVASLQNAGLEVIEHGGVKPNPVLSHLRAGIELAKKEKVDVVLGVGGGSSIDESKAIAAGAVIDDDVWKFYTGELAIEDNLPVLSVLTVPATGTEMNGGTVVTNDETNQKYGFLDSHLCPKASIMDPTVTYSVPLQYTAYAAVDCFSHMTEGYFTHDDEWAPIQDRFVEALARTVMDATERIMKDPNDYQGRATLMWSTSLAWNGLLTAGVRGCKIPAHLLEHPLSGLYDIAHGAGLSIVIPAWMTWSNRRGNKKIAQFAENVFGISGDDPVKTGEKGIAALKAWFEKIKSPTSLAAADIPESDIEKIADFTFELAGVWDLPEYTKDIIIEIYKLCAV